MECSNFALGPEVPVDGNFSDLEFAFAGEEQDLYVESETAESLDGEQLLGDLPPKTLESALGVLKSRKSQHSDLQVVHAAHEMPQERLADASGALDLSRAYCDVEVGILGR